jgi:hypothetical protein
MATEKQKACHKKRRQVDMKFFTLIIGVIFMLFPLTGCLAPNSVIVNHPDLNVETEVEIGQSMISISRKFVYPAIANEKEIIHTSEDINYSYTLTIPVDVFRVAYLDDNGTFFQSNPMPQLNIKLF